MDITEFEDLTKTRPTTLRDLDLKGLDLSKRDLRAVDFINCNMSNCNLDYANLSGSLLTKVNLKGATTKFTQFYGTQLNLFDFTAPGEFIFDKEPQGVFTLPGLLPLGARVDFLTGQELLKRGVILEEELIPSGNDLNYMISPSYAGTWMYKNGKLTKERVKL